MDTQLDLFGDPISPPKQPRKPAATAQDRRPQAAPPQPDHVALASRLPESVRLGTSTWSYPGWEHIVYAGRHPPATLSRLGLTAYSAHPLLRTVGICHTYYAPISKDDFSRYAEQVPASFSFLVKAPNRVTSPFIQGGRGYTAQRNPDFLDVEQAVRSFIDPALAGLAGKAGPLVFQFSPLGPEATHAPEVMAQRLVDFLAQAKSLSQLPANGPSQICVEVRNAQLLTPAFARGLADAGIGYCVGIHPRMPSAATQLEIMEAALQRGLVVRWTLHPTMGRDFEAAKEQYAPFSALVDEDPTTRAVLAAAAVRAIGRGEKAHMVANNKAEGSSPLTMFKLAQSIANLLEQGVEPVF